MSDTEKIIVKFPESWKRPDLEIDPSLPVDQTGGAYIILNSPLNMSNVHWLMKMLERTPNVLILDAMGSMTMFDLVNCLMMTGLKDAIRDAVRDAVRDMGRGESDGKPYVPGGYQGLRGAL